VREDLHEAARLLGVQPRYHGLEGDVNVAPDEVLAAVIEALGGDEAVERERAEPAGRRGTLPRCFVPDFLERGRVWGVTCQLYGLRSERNAGIGDLEDLGRLAEIAGRAGADFLGVNPLNALFFHDPGRYSPFSPSNRQFLNPVYIALDAVPGAAPILAGFSEDVAKLREAPLIDYWAVTAVKRLVLERVFEGFDAEAPRSLRADFASYLAQEGPPLAAHALFETISEAMMREHRGSGWLAWPDGLKDPTSEEARAFAEAHAPRVRFHAWLQWLMDRQLAEAQARAKASGMRIGLYMDLAVGVVPDGSATWSDPTLTVPSMRIGAPPDYFNDQGQNWGLAPLSPTELHRRGFEPLRRALADVVRHAGALRIDHAMSLTRLFWIAEGRSAREGVYVGYPVDEMIGTIARVSREAEAIIIGEDLGVVPPGFREDMRAAEIQAYRVFFFERYGDAFFKPPGDYPREALACVGTHDMPSLKGWWQERDLDVRAAIGMSDEAATGKARAERAHERRRLLGLLDAEGLLPAAYRPVMHGEAPAPAPMPDDLVVGLHAMVARAPSRLFAVQAEELTGAVEQANIPGTVDEHPNWRQRLPLTLEELPESRLFQELTRALAAERPVTRPRPE